MSNNMLPDLPSQDAHMNNDANLVVAANQYAYTPVLNSDSRLHPELYFDLNGIKTRLDEISFDAKRFFKLRDEFTDMRCKAVSNILASCEQKTLFGKKYSFDGLTKNDSNIIKLLSVNNRESEFIIILKNAVSKTLGILADMESKYREILSNNIAKLLDNLLSLMDYVNKNIHFVDAKLVAEKLFLSNPSNRDLRKLYVQAWSNELNIENKLNKNYDPAGMNVWYSNLKTNITRSKSVIVNSFKGFHMPSGTENTMLVAVLTLVFIGMMMFTKPSMIEYERQLAVLLK